MAEETIPIIRTKLHRPPIPENHIHRPRLLEQLEKGRHRQLTLVFDDYYLIKETVVHNLLANILKHPPQSLHLVIVGRHDPPLPISKSDDGDPNPAIALYHSGNGDFF
jgi:ATP/maltotriose-dependent transcriptional regulator MalT